ncbi:MAG: molybdate ABC transporter substrate-binding protein, partial [Pseudomonadales bacterium]|nr:molybdate ABC transporter substrate-binding protein [Pseudomonadales bacterium]
SILPPTLLSAESLNIAVAANFRLPATALVKAFETTTGMKGAIITSSSSGKLYAQILQGAPYDIFLSADQEKPALLENRQLTVPGSRFTYAIGKLALWSSRPDIVDDKGEVLHRGQYTSIAIANPRLAPYGKAAQSILNNPAFAPPAGTRIILGENISQVYHFSSSGNADLGFIAASQLYNGFTGEGTATGSKSTKGSFWLIPINLYPPIKQDAVLLARASQSAAAKAFLAFLKSSRAKSIIESFGYELDVETDHGAL